MASKKLLYAVAATCFLYAAVGASTALQAGKENLGVALDPTTLTFLSLAAIGIAAIVYSHAGHKPKSQHQVRPQEKRN